MFVCLFSRSVGWLVGLTLQPCNKCKTTTTTEKKTQSKYVQYFFMTFQLRSVSSRAMIFIHVSSGAQDFQPLIVHSWNDFYGALQMKSICMHFEYDATTHFGDFVAFAPPQDVTQIGGLFTSLGFLLPLLLFLFLMFANSKSFV